MDGGSTASAPVVHLDAFDGPLDLLLELARAQKVDLGRIAIAELVDPFVAAITAPGQTTPLAQRSDWLVTASWLIWLKSRLLLPDALPEAEEARQAAERLREHLTAAAHVRALASWLEARPQLGQDVLGRGCVEVPVYNTPAKGDLLDLLVACLAVYDAPVAPTALVYRPVARTLWTVQAALERLRSLLIAHPDGGELAQFLPPLPASTPEPALHARAALASTFLAGLELTRQEAARMTQAENFDDIHLLAGMRAISRQTNATDCPKADMA